VGDGANRVRAGFIPKSTLLYEYKLCKKRLELRV